MYVGSWCIFLQYYYQHCFRAKYYGSSGFEMDLSENINQNIPLKVPDGRQPHEQVLHSQQPRSEPQLLT